MCPHFEFESFFYNLHGVMVNVRFERGTVTIS